MKRIVVLFACISTSVFGWQLPRFVNRDLVRADELTLTYHAYDGLGRLVQHCVMMTAYQSITLEQYVASLNENELALIQQVCSHVAGSVQQAYEQLQEAATAYDALQKRYKKADRSCFRPRLDARLSTLAYLPQLARLLRAAWRQHAVYFFTQEQLGRAARLCDRQGALSQESCYEIAFEHAYLSLLHEYCEQRYRFFSVEIGHVSSRLWSLMHTMAPADADDLHQRAARDAEEALIGTITDLQKQTIKDEQSQLARLYELQSATKRLHFMHLGCAAGAALIGGLVSFGFFCGVEALKALYHAHYAPSARIVSL